MKSRYLILFASVLAVLVVLYIVQERSSKITVVKTGIELLLPDLETEKVVEIRAQFPKQASPGLIMKKTENGWVIPSYYNAKANEKKIENLLKSLQDLKGEKRAANEALFATFRVGDDEAFTVEFLDKNSDPLLVLLIGKKGPEGKSFLRFKGKPEVYLSNKNLLATFGIFGDEPKAPEQRFWADLKVLQTTKNDWSEVEFKLSEKKFLFVKEKQKAEDKEKKSEQSDTAGSKSAPVWIQQEPASPQLDKNQIIVTLNRLQNLHADQLLDPKSAESYGLDDPSHEVRIKLADGKTIGLSFKQPKEKGPVYVKSTEQDMIFELLPANFESLFKIIEDKGEKARKKLRRAPVHGEHRMERCWSRAFGWLEKSRAVW